MKMKFDSSIYSEKAIREGAKAFGKIAKITVQPGADGYVCTVRDSIYSPEKTAKEFGNYVLNLSVTMSGGGSDDLL